jgi:CDP-6-deoxy-D-xylo-4-hexulose-3-dehydrase
MSKLDSNKYHTDIELEGQCNYAFIVVLKEGSFEIRDKVESTLRERGIEFRRGLSGGGNQLRQPYFKKNYNINYDDFKNMDHVHHFGWYVGNYPTLEREKINTLIKTLNNI